MALPEPHHGCLAEVVRSRRPDWPLLQVPGLWDPQCLTGFPRARVRLQGTDVAATFPAAVGLASSLLPNARASVLVSALGIEVQKLLNFEARLQRAAPQRGVAIPRCGVETKTKSPSTRLWTLCVYLSYLVVPILSLVGLCVDPDQPRSACDGARLLGW